MKNTTAEETQNQTHAKSLLAQIHAAETIIPRRESIVEWLDGYLLRSERKGYVMEPTESDDLAALDSFLREYRVPGAIPIAG